MILAAERSINAGGLAGLHERLESHVATRELRADDPVAQCCAAITGGVEGTGEKDGCT